MVYKLTEIQQKIIQRNTNVWDEVSHTKTGICVYRSAECAAGVGAGRGARGAGA